MHWHPEKSGTNPRWINPDVLPSRYPVTMDLFLWFMHFYLAADFLIRPSPIQKWLHSTLYCGKYPSSSICLRFLNAGKQ
jgi:hypothetical protein